MVLFLCQLFIQLAKYHIISGKHDSTYLDLGKLFHQQGKDLIMQTEIFCILPGSLFPPFESLSRRSRKIQVGFRGQGRGNPPELPDKGTNRETTLFKKTEQKTL